MPISHPEFASWNPAKALLDEPVASLTLRLYLTATARNLSATGLFAVAIRPHPETRRKRSVRGAFKRTNKRTE